MERKWWTLLLVSVATFMLLLDVTIVNVALPDIQRELGASLSSLQWVVDAYSLMLAAFLLTAGSLGDRLGRRRVFTIGFGIFTFASFLCGISGDPTLLNLARGLQGIGAAGMFATSLALIGQEFHGKDRATAFGVWGATVGGAVAVGPLVGGVITENLGWEWIFFVNVPIGIAAMVLTERKIVNVFAEKPEPIDFPGLVTFSGSLFLLVFGLIRGNPEGWGSTRILACLIGAAVLMVAFIAIELRSRTRCSTSAVPQAGLQRRLRGRLLPLGGDVRDVPLPDDLHAGRARLLAAGGRPALPAADRPRLRRRADLRLALAQSPDPDPARRRARPGRRRPAADGRRLGRLGAGRRCSPASSSPGSASARPTRASARRRSRSSRWRNRGWARGSTRPSARSGSRPGWRRSARSSSRASTRSSPSSSRTRPAASANWSPRAARGRSPTRSAGGPRRHPSHAADAAFVTGFNEILLIAGIVSFVGAVAGFALVRSQDFVQPTGGPRAGASGAAVQTA